MSDSDSDLPDLVDSSDEEPTTKKKKQTSSDHAKLWLEKSGKFLDRQENSIRIFALGPFLFGINTFLPLSWMKHLKDAGLLLNDKREKSLAGLDWEEWSMVDIVDTVVSVMQRKLRRRLYLVSCLDLIKSIDEQKGVIFTKEFLREAEKYDNIVKLWAKCKKNPTCGKYEKETKFAVIYVAKLYSSLVLKLAEEGKDFSEEFKRNLRPKSGLDPSKFKNAGNEQYQCGNFETAADYYAKAALADPLNHIYFGNRGQSYFKLKKFSEALADGRRAVTLKPDWCKGHYRYAQAFYQLDKLDLAISVNRKGLQICQNLKGKHASDTNLLDLEQQGKKFLQEREAKLREEKVRKILEDTDLASQFLEEDLPSEIRNLPSKKRVIKLTEALRALGDFPSSNGQSDVPDLISSDSSSDEEEDIIVKRTNIKPVKEHKPEPKKVEEKPHVKPDVRKKEPPVSRTTAKENQKPAQPTSTHQPIEQNSRKNENKNNSQKDNNNQTTNIKPVKELKPEPKKVEEKPHVKPDVRKKEPPVSRTTAKENQKPAQPTSTHQPIEQNSRKNENKNNSQKDNNNQTNKGKKKEGDKSGSPAPTQENNKKDMPKKIPAESVSTDTLEPKEFSRILKEGMELQCNGLYKNALTSYHKALEMAEKVQGKVLGLEDEQDFVSLKYAYGTAAVSTGIYKNILDGIEKFNEIVENHENVRFPMVYYGLGKAYVSLKRFSQAEEPLKQGLRMVETFGSPSMVITWPGTNTKMEESVPDHLRNLLKNLIQETKFPPTPDAVCRYHNDTEEDRTAIYTDDPAFKGFVRMMCQSHCVIEFHAACWRVYKLTYGDRTTDKDILDKPCPTPDCGTFIIKITIIRQDAHQKEIESDKDYKNQAGQKKKAPMKTPITNVERLQKKQEKRELKKQRKSQQREESSDLIEDVTEIIGSRDDKGEKTSALQGATGNKVVTETGKDVSEESLAKAAVSVLKKEEEDKLQKYKGTSKKSKNKKKKEKAPKPQVIQLDVNFSGDREKNLLTEHSVTDEENVSDGRDRNFSVPTGLKKKVDKFEDDFRKQGDQSMTETDEFDEITQNLFLLFEDMLNAHGPLHVEDTKITSLCEDFPQDAKDKIKEAGGMSRFLKQSFRFGVIDDVVCLMKDAVKAQEISKARQNARQRLQTVEAPKPLVNPWKMNTGAKAPISLKTSSDFPSLKNPPAVNLSESLIEKLGKSAPGRSTPSKGISELDTFDDFTVAKTGGMAGLNDDFDIDVPKTRSKMDDLDDIPVCNSKRKKERKKKTYNMDDIDSFSDSEVESNQEGSVISDRESFSSELSSSRSNILQGQGQSVSIKSGENIAMTISRSSSKSDVSEKSDLSDLVKPIKQGESRSSPSVTKDRGFGPIGSPSTFDSKAALENSGISQPKPLKIPPGLSTHQQPMVSSADSTFQHVDGESVNLVATEVVNRIYHGKNVSQEEKLRTYKQVLRDVLSEYQRTGRLPTPDTVLSQTASNTKPGTSGFDLSAIDQGRNKIANADQYMKSFYQKSTIDPYSAYKKPAVTTNISSSSVLLPSSSSSNSYSFPSIHSNDPAPPQPPPPPPLSLPVPSSTSLTGQFPSIHSENTFPFPSTSSSNIWSTNDASSIPNALSLTTPQSEPSMKLPEKPSPFFSNFSIGTSLTQEEKPLTLSGYSDALLRKHQSVQVAPLCVSREVMTDPYEPYKEDIARMMEERKFMESQLKLAQKQIQELSDILTARDQRNQAVETDFKNRLTLLEKEKNLIQSENQLYTKELERINMDNKSKKAAETEYQKAIVTYKEKLLEIQRQQSEERKVAMQQNVELTELQKSQEDFRKTVTEEYNRARAAEVEVLNVKMRTAVQMLERSQKEFLFYQHNLASMIKKFEEEYRTVTPSMQQSLEHYRHISMKCEETIIRIKTEFSEQIKQIQDGTKTLSELPAVFVPPPPPPPQLPPMMTPEPQVAPQGGVASLSSLAGGSVIKSDSSSKPGVTVSSSANINTLGASTQATPKPLGLPAGLQQPKPLVPPLGMGSLPQRPYTGSSMMGSVPPGLNTPGAQAQGRNSFEKLVAKLQAFFPQYNRATFTQFIQKLRESRGGSLSGMTLDDIVAKVTSLIQEQERKQSPLSSQQLLQTNTSSTVPDVTEARPPKPLTPPTWATGQLAGFTEVFEEEEDPCVICHEEMTPPTTVKLECNHRFHDECIRKWLKEQSTCPNCRIYALLPDEFPSLS